MAFLSDVHPAWTDAETAPHLDVLTDRELTQQAHVRATLEVRDVFADALNAARLAAWRLRVDPRDAAWAHVRPTPPNMSHLRLVREHKALLATTEFRIISGRARRN